MPYKLTLTYNDGRIPSELNLGGNDGLYAIRSWNGIIDRKDLSRATLHLGDELVVERTWGDAHG